MDCKSASLCLFDEKDIQVDITGNVVTDYYPLTSLSAGGPIEFTVPGTVDEYIDLSDIKLHLRTVITKSDGQPLAKEDKVCFVNQPISSLFKDVFVAIGDKQIEGGQHCYPYNGYLSSLLQFHPSAKNCHMQAWGWHEDDPGKFDVSTNEGCVARAIETAVSKEWELEGPLFLDITRQSRYLIPQIDMRFKFLPATPEFVLHEFDSAVGTTYKITKAILYVRRMRVRDSVIAGHNLGLQKRNAIYNVNHVDISSFTITKGNRNYIKDSLFPSQTPKLLVIGCLEHDAFNGNVKKSPFNFQHFNINKIGLYRDGELVPGQIFNPDFASNHVLRSYNNSMNVLNYYNTDDSNGVTLEHFKKGYTLWAFDLTPNADCHAAYRSINFNSSLRLELNFASALTKTINVLLFAVFDSKLEITGLRDVILSYNR